MVYQSQNQGHLSTLVGYGGTKNKRRTANPDPGEGTDLAGVAERGGGGGGAGGHGPPNTSKSQILVKVKFIFKTIQSNHEIFNHHPLI